MIYLPPQCFAVRFQEEDKAKGAGVLFYRGGPGAGLGYGILVVGEEDLRLLNRAGVKYESYETNGDVNAIYRHFNITPKGK